MAHERCLVDAEQFQLFQKLVVDSVVYSKGDQLSVNRDRLQKAIAHGLAFIDSKWQLDDELINALQRLPVAVTIEAVCRRRNPNTGGMEVLLTKRRDVEPNHLVQWCCPRATKQPGESDDQALDRIGLALAANLSHRKWFGSGSSSHLPGHWRRFYRCEVADGANGTWFPVNDIPAMDMTAWEFAFFIRPPATV